MENDMMDQDGSQTDPVVDTEDGNVDDVADFIDMNDAVEVRVNDDLPMEEEAEDNGMLDKGSKNDDGGEDGQIENTIPDLSNFQLKSHTDSVYAVASVVENGQLSILSGGGDDKAFQYKLSSANGERSTAVTPLPYAHTDTVSSVAYNIQYIGSDPKKTPKLAAVGSYDGSIVIYDPDTGTQRLKLEGPSDVEWMSFHPKGGTVLLVGSGDGTLWMFHIPLNRCMQVYVGHEQAVTAGCFSPDGKWALSASSDGTLRIWAPKTGLNKHVFRLGEAGLTCMANNGGSDGMLVIAGSEDGQAHVCHIGTKKVIASLRHFEFPATKETAENDDEEMEYPMSIESVGFSPAQPNWCATGGVDGKLKIWDLTIDGHCRQVCIHTNNTSADGITRISWHPTLPFVFVSTISGKVRVWDARNGNLLHTLTGGSTEQINDMDIQFLPDGSAVIVTASDDNIVRVFELDVNALTHPQTAPETSMQS